MPAEGECTGDVVFVLESSTFTGFLNWAVSVQFVTDVMKGLKISREGTHVSVVVFSTEVKCSFDLNSYFAMDDIEPVVLNLEYMADLSNTAESITLMHQILKDQGRGFNMPIAVILTAGGSFFHEIEGHAILKASSAKDDGIEIFAVGKYFQTFNSPTR